MTFLPLLLMFELMQERVEITEVVQQEFSLGTIYRKTVEWLKFIRSRWLMILSITLIAGIAGFLYADYFNKITYTADLTFVLEEAPNNSGALSGALGLANTFGIDIGGAGSGGAFSGNNIMELMRTRKMVERTLLSPFSTGDASISMADEYLQINRIDNLLMASEKIHPASSGQSSALSRRQDSVLGLIYQRIVFKNELTVAQVDKKVSFVKVSFTSENDLFAKEFVTRLAQEVSDFYILTKSLKNKQNVAILERQADSIKSELNHAIVGVAAANDNTYNLNPALNIKRTPSSRRQIDVQANTAILTELVKNLQIARMTLMKETPLIQIIDEPILPLAKQGKKRLATMILWSVFAAFVTVFFLVVKRILRTLNIKEIR